MGAPATEGSSIVLNVPKVTTIIAPEKGITAPEMTITVLPGQRDLPDLQGPIVRRVLPVRIPTAIAILCLSSAHITVQCPLHGGIMSVADRFSAPSLGSLSAQPSQPA